MTTPTSTAVMAVKIADDAIMGAAMHAGFSMPRAAQKIADGLAALLVYEDGQLSSAQERERLDAARRLATAWDELVVKDEARTAASESWGAEA